MRTWVAYHYGQVEEGCVCLLEGADMEEVARMEGKAFV